MPIVDPEEYAALKAKWQAEYEAESRRPGQPGIHGRLGEVRFAYDTWLHEEMARNTPPTDAGAVLAHNVGVILASFAGCYSGDQIEAETGRLVEMAALAALTSARRVLTNGDGVGTITLHEGVRQ